MYVERNIEARSCSHFGRGNAICITYSECVFVALSIWHSKSKRHIVICVLLGSTIFFCTLSHKVSDFSAKKFHKTMF